MRILALSTVGEACEVALCQGRNTLSEISEPMTKGHDTRLPIIVKKAMQDADAKYSSIDRIAVIAGPGSFTGVRVGVAFARGLGVSLNVPVIGITSLEASLPPESTGKTLVALPAKRRLPDLSWWAQGFQDGARIGPPVEANSEQMKRLITKSESVFGMGLEPLIGLEYGKVQPNLMHAVQLASLADAEELGGSDPQYVREPDAVPMKPITPKSN